MIAGIVVAGGASRRMGAPKALCTLDGRTFVSRVASALLDADLARVVVVLGADAETVRAGACLPRDPRLQLVQNDDWAAGLSSSLRVGLAACADAEAAVVALADQPTLDAARVRAVCAAWHPSRSLVAPWYDGVVGHPVLFARRLFAEIALLSGDVGARAVVERHRGDGVLLALPPLPDADTPEAWAALRAAVESGAILRPG